MISVTGRCGQLWAVALSVINPNAETVTNEEAINPHHVLRIALSITP
jgi:hypothetical protein